MWGCAPQAPFFSMFIAPDDPISPLRRQLASEITRSLGGSQSQHVVAPYFGISQPRMSELSRGLVERYTIEWLIRRIHYLGGSVTIAVTLADAHRVWSAVMRQRSLARRAAPSPDTRPR